MKLSRGFTLIEVLLTIGALTLLFVALAVVIDPAVELQKIRDARRAAQVDTIYGALENYFAVNGTYPQGVLQLDNGSSIEICASGIPQATCQNDGLLFLSGALEPDFIAEIPTDSQATGNSSGFSIQKNISGQIGVSAPLVEFRDEVVIGAPTSSGLSFMNATGGAESTITIGSVSYRVHTFTTSGTFTVIEPGTVDYLIVAGGGGGGGVIGGGGGAGGVIRNSTELTTGDYPVVVGAGGRGGYGWNSTTQGGEQGGNSSAFGEVAIGGGGGAHHWGNSRPTGTIIDGGSGGGGGYDNNGYQEGGIGISGQGNDGGSVVLSDPNHRAGGGGGAGGAGQDATLAKGGDGGLGVYFGDQFGDTLGSSGWVASGGGGGARLGTAFPGVGTNGGGDGEAGSLKAEDGEANTGSGGGGSGYDGNNLSGQILGGNGGSGVVTIRYPIES